MEILIISIIAIIFAVCALLTFIALKRTSKKFDATTTKYEELKINYAISQQDEMKLRHRNEVLDEERGDLIAKKTEAETKMSSLQDQLVKSNEQVAQLISDKEKAIEERNNYKSLEQLAQQRIKTIEMQMQDWEKTKQQHLEITKASVLKASGEVSNKLLADHKREAENAKKESEKIVKQTTEQLLNQHKSIVESVNTLNEDVKKSSSTFEIVHRSLLSPSGAGTLGEITLANILKNSGLIEGQDYYMQHNVKNEEGSNLRPDAVVNLPDNNVMVIDSKASSFFLELGQDNLDENRSKELNAGLKRSMNDNLKDLASREYSKAIEEQAGKSLARVYMFLPTESALEKLRKVDPAFMGKAWSQRILPVGPSGLVNALWGAAMQISGAKQEENSKIIISEVKKLINSFAILNIHASGVGKSLKSALDKYDKFSASFNSNLMSKANKINKLGVDADKLKDIEPLQQYKLTTLDIKQIEADHLKESEEQIENTPQLVAEHE